jgi:hypothetical protein
MSEMMGRNEYARHRGCSPNAVSKAIKDQRIAKAVVIDDAGKFIGIKWRLADELWALNTDPEAAAKGGRGELLMPPSSELEEPEGESAPAEPRDPGYRDMLTRVKRAEAQLKEMQALERAGELIVADDVERENEEIARAVRNAMLAIPDRLAQALDPANPERARKLLDNEIKKALRGLESKLDQRAAATTEGETALQ